MLIYFYFIFGYILQITTWTKPRTEAIVRWGINITPTNTHRTYASLHLFLLPWMSIPQCWHKPRCPPVSWATWSISSHVKAKIAERSKRKKWTTSTLACMYMLSMQREKENKAWTLVMGQLEGRTLVGELLSYLMVSPNVATPQKEPMLPSPHHVAVVETIDYATLVAILVLINHPVIRLKIVVCTRAWVRLVNR
jgi:hypothetical protein